MLETMSNPLKYMLATLTGVLLAIILWYVIKIIFLYYPVSTNTIKTIHYPKHSESSRSAENWFYNYDNGFEANKRYVIETCVDIKRGYVTYDWEYKSTCSKLGIDVE